MWTSYYFFVDGFHVYSFRFITSVKMALRQASYMISIINHATNEWLKLTINKSLITSWTEQQHHQPKTKTRNIYDFIWNKQKSNWFLLLVTWHARLKKLKRPRHVDWSYIVSFGLAEKKIMNFFYYLQIRCLQCIFTFVWSGKLHGNRHWKFFIRNVSLDNVNGGR